jgi:hypothetical protein
MDIERWRQLSELFRAVVGRPLDERRVLLNRACPGDRALASEVEQLIRAHEDASELLSGFTRSSSTPSVAPARPGNAVQDFPGTERFAVRRMLGTGGMGVVYEVHDRVRDETVALKTLLRTDATDIYRLKREFRSLAGAAHRNLISLYELFVEGPLCFFTMELVHGVSFVDYVRAGSRRIDRLRWVLPQLVEGLTALHRHGQLHRDVKPSNVLVTADGRVVILDFGLVTPRRPEDGGDRVSIAGTPAYMAPEQMLGAAVSEASDWYSVGVMTYEALTGELPIPASTLDLIEAKTTSDPPSPRDVAPDVPEDLSAMCVGLLCRDPELRLSGQQALHRLSDDARSTRADTADEPAAEETVFVGRVDQLQLLHRAFETISRGRTAAIFVHGPSGIGKSALVRRFLDEVRTRADEPLVLKGRCYEHESVPYRALDGVIDNLSQYLAMLTRSGARELMPRHLGALSRLFPVLMRVDIIADATRHAQESPDPSILRRHAVSALRELLARIADRRSVILAIDDLHWSDADSIALLDELLRPPESPALLLVACFRSEETAVKPFLQALIDRCGSQSTTALALGAMTDRESAELVASLIPASLAVNLEERLRIVREGAGNPFFLEQLTRDLAITRVGPHQGYTVADMLGGRLRMLPAGARAFVETLAICGRPMPPRLVHEASGLTGDERPLVAFLRAAHLVRSSGSAERIELYHDRIREALVSEVPADEARRIHEVMARTLVSRGIDDPQGLFEHYRGAGDHDRAASQAERAATQANAVLAFDRAAMFYRHALTMAPQAAVSHEWRKALATALANAGRPPDAAEAFLDAAAHADAADRIELLRRGAEQFLIGGHIDRGMTVIRAVLSAADVRLRRRRRAVLASLMVRRARLRWRGLGFVERPMDRIEPPQLLRIDTCWSVLTGLALADTARSAEVSARHVLLALDAGEPYRIARALAMEGAFVSIGGGRSARRAAALIQRSRAIAETEDNPHAIALSTLMAGAAAIATGHWNKAGSLGEEALQILRDRCVGVTWELSLAHIVSLWALMYLGEMRELSRRLPPLLDSARAYGNLSLATELCTRMNLFWLAADRPDEGDRQLRASMDQWSQLGFHRQHYSATLARIQTELYRGNADLAWRLVTERESQLRSSLLLHMQVIRIEDSYLRGRCAVALAPAARSTASAARLVAVARREAQRIANENMAWASPLADLLQAAAAYRERNVVKASERLAEAVHGFDLADMHLYAAVARRRLGALLGGGRGEDLAHRADEWMTAQAIRNPRSMTRMLAPGFDDLDLLPL